MEFRNKIPNVEFTSAEPSVTTVFTGGWVTFEMDIA
jgi:hypothetical protein